MKHDALRPSLTILPLLSAALFTMMSAQRADADTINLQVNADASVRLSGTTMATMGNSEANFGTEQILRVNYSTTSAQTNAKAYMRFDLGNTQPSSITGASLNLYTATAGYNSANVFDIYGLRDGYAGVDNNGNGSTTDDADIHGQTWPEGVIDWNSAPANQLTSSGSPLAPADRNKFTSDAVFLGQLTIAADAPLNTQVSFSGAGLQSFLQGDSDRSVTLMIAANQETIFSFLSREAADQNGMTGYGPQLVLQTQTQPVPEPSTYAMMGLGIGALFLVGWKRKRSASPRASCSTVAI